MKIKGKTTDGIRLGDIVNTILQLPNVIAKEGSRHAILLKYCGQPAYAGMPAGLCAVAPSTSYRQHIVPWVKRITGYDANTINTAFQEGSWYKN